MSGPCLSSSVPDRPLRPGTRRSLGGPLPPQLADRARTNPAAAALRPPFTLARPRGINPSFPGLSPSTGHVIHVLLTRAPLNNPCIATRIVPCDLHVLNTPPAFVLSQNQTLRKKRMVSGAVAGPAPSFEPLQDFSSCLPRALCRTRSAQFNLFPLPGNLPFSPPVRRDSHPASKQRARAGPHCQRSSFEATKKPIGCGHTTIDIPSPDRPLSWRPANLPLRARPRQLILKNFFGFLHGARIVGWVTRFSAG